MTNEMNVWQGIRSTYLNEVEKALAKVSSSRRKEVLSDVAAHLDQRFGELIDDQKTWENFQAIITDMGPAAEYAELLEVETVASGKSFNKTTVCIILASVIIPLVIVVAFLMFNAALAGKTDVSIDDFYLIPSRQEHGRYQLVASIHNNGLRDSKKFPVHFYLGSPDTEKPRRHSAGSIKSGDTWNEATMPFVLRDGVNNFSVVIDPAGKINDPDRSNNKKVLTVTIKGGKVAPMEAKRIEDDIDLPFKEDVDVLGFGLAFCDEYVHAHAASG